MSVYRFPRSRQSALPYPATLDLSFIGRDTLDSRITFTRASTATYFDATGTLQSAAIDVPRFDYDPATMAARGFLIEEARTNSVRYSQNQTIERRITLTGISGTFLAGETVTATGGGTGTVYAVIGSVVELTIAAGAFTGTLTSSGGATGTIAAVVVPYFYTASGTGVIPVATENYAVAPDGTTTATRIIFDKGAGATIGDASVVSSQGYTTTAGQPQAASVWLKSNTGSTYTVRFDFNGPAADAGGTSSTLTVTPTWQRFTIALASASDTLRTSTLRLRGTLGTSDYADILVWGWQHEVDKAFSTSYIPTTTGPVTREADAASVNTLSPWFNASEGTLFVEASPQTSNVVTFNFIDLNNTTTSNRIALSKAATSGNASLFVNDANSPQCNISSATWTAAGKLAGAYAANDFATSYNGATPAIDNTGTVPSVTRMQIGVRADGANQLTGHIRRITYYPVRLSNTDLQAITA